MISSIKCPHCNKRWEQPNYKWCPLCGGWLRKCR